MTRKNIVQAMTIDLSSSYPVALSDNCGETRNYRRKRGLNDSAGHGSRLKSLKSDIGISFGSSRRVLRTCRRRQRFVVLSSQL